MLLFADVEGAAGFGSVLPGELGIVVLGGVVVSAIFLPRCYCYRFDGFQLVRVASHNQLSCRSNSKRVVDLCQHRFELEDCSCEVRCTVADGEARNS
jgi:hypothetical protein